LGKNYNNQKTTMGPESQLNRWCADPTFASSSNLPGKKNERHKERGRKRTKGQRRPPGRATSEQTPHTKNKKKNKKSTQGELKTSKDGKALTGKLEMVREKTHTTR